MGFRNVFKAVYPVYLMKKEGKINYDSGNVVRFLIISILIVSILITGSLIYHLANGNSGGTSSIETASSVGGGAEAEMAEIIASGGKNYIVENPVCNSARECIELAVSEKNRSICNYIKRPSPSPYSFIGCFEEVRIKLRGEGLT